MIVDILKNFERWSSWSNMEGSHSFAVGKDDHQHKIKILSQTSASRYIACHFTSIPSMVISHFCYHGIAQNVFGQPQWQLSGLFERKLQWHASWCKQYIQTEVPAYVYITSQESETHTPPWCAVSSGPWNAKKSSCIFASFTCISNTQGGKSCSTFCKHSWQFREPSPWWALDDAQSLLKQSYKLYGHSCVVMAMKSWWFVASMPTSCMLRKLARRCHAAAVSML